MRILRLYFVSLLSSHMITILRLYFVSLLAAPPVISDWIVTIFCLLLALFLMRIFILFLY